MSSRHSNSARRLPRIVALSALSVVLVLTVAYAVTSAYLTGLATTAERHLAVGTPSDLGLDFQAVSFVSPLDQIELRGWYLPAGGKRAIIFIHGIHGNRWDTFHHIDELIARHVRGSSARLVAELVPEVSVELDKIFEAARLPAP